MQGALEPSHVEFVATHYLRQKARNAKKFFLSRLERCYPYRLKIISGPEEGSLISILVLPNTTQSEGNR